MPAAPVDAAGPPTPPTTAPPNPPAKAELLVDLDTGRALFARSAHIPMPPGSLSKILTALIAVAWLPHSSLIPVSAQAASVTPERIGMEPGQQWPFEEVLQAALIFSANDAAYALAQQVSGSLGRFAALMAESGLQIGLMDHPVLRDPAGLDGSEGFEGGNLISAWDVAIMARDLMANSQLAAIVRSPRLDFKGPNGTVYGLRNQNLYFLSTYPGAIGVKTGLTDRAGFCVAEEAERGGRHMLAVVLNGANSYQSAAFLLDRGFATPATAEPTNAEVLPPVAFPGRPPPPPPAKLVRLGAEHDEEVPAVSADPVHTPASRLAGLWVDAGAVVAVVVAALVLWVLWGRISPRKRPGAGPNRRR